MQKIKVQMINSYTARTIYSNSRSSFHPFIF